MSRTRLQARAGPPVPLRGKDRLTDLMLAKLSEQIRASGLEPGDRLPTEQELCESYDVSRTVVREVIASLKARGVVESRRGSGLFVADGVESGPPAIALAPTDLERISDILDVLELRLGVEVEAASLAAQRRSEAQLFSVLQAERDLALAMEAGDMGSRADFLFHRAIAEATGNARFVAFMDQLEPVLIPRQVLGAKPDLRGKPAVYLDLIRDEHRAIALAISDRDTVTAAQAMRHHLEGSRRRYQQWKLAVQTPA